MQWPTSQTRMKGGQPCEGGSARAYSSACRLALSMSTSQARRAPGLPRSGRIGLRQKIVALSGDCLVAALPAALLGFENERILAIEIDPADRVAIVTVTRHDALEDVIVALVRAPAGSGCGNPSASQSSVRNSA